MTLRFTMMKRFIPWRFFLYAAATGIIIILAVYLFEAVSRFYGPPVELTKSLAQPMVLFLFIGVIAAFINFLRWGSQVPVTDPLELREHYEQYRELSRREVWRNRIIGLLALSAWLTASWIWPDWDNGIVGWAVQFLKSNILTLIP